MTTHAPRVPFAPLDNPRLQHLANAKNRQNGALAQKSTSALNGKSNILKTVLNKRAFDADDFDSENVLKTVSSSNKRTFDATSFDDFDSENVDPATFDSPTKKSKSNGAFEKPYEFTLTSTKSMPPPSAFSRFSTPIKASAAAGRSPMTAPAGRSPKRKIAGISKNRRVSAPFSRIDPPFASRTTSTLPFSLDAVLGGSSPVAAPPPSAGATIQETMPKNWIFEIYEDTPEEEAANLMEHSTLTLDLSSDDEGGRKDVSRGKENTPPDGYDAPTASRSGEETTTTATAAPRRGLKSELVRKKADVDEMDDGERSPLCSLETEHFIPEGLDKDSHVLIEEGVEKASGVKEFTAPVPFEVVEKKKVEEKVEEKVEVVKKDERKDEVVVWEDKEGVVA